MPAGKRDSGSEHLAGVQDAEGIEDAGDVSLQGPLIVAQLLGEPASLEHADAVLTGERAAERERRAEQLLRRLPHHRGDFGPLEDEVRMQVAVARVGDGGDDEAVLPFGGKRFRVVGVLKKVGQNAAGFNFDNALIYPYTAATINFKNPDYDPMLIIQARSGTPVADLEVEVEGALRSIRKLPPGQPNNFAINQLSQISQRLDSLFGVINGIGWLIGGFSLVVGLFGIANIMFVTVKERTRFIGLKKAIGARRLDILTEFLIEAVVLCLIGGIIGLLLVGLLGWIMSTAFDFPVALSLKNILIGMGVSTLVGLLAGFIPARRASRLNPVVAIRSN